MKKLKYLFLVPLCFFTFGIMNVEAASTTISCGGQDFPAATANLISTFITILMVATPIILIITGMLDFMKATTASKEEEMKKAQSKFIKRLFSGVCVFLVVLFVKIVVGLLPSSEVGGATECLDAILNGTSSSTSTSVKDIYQFVREGITYEYEMPNSYSLTSHSDIQVVMTNNNNSHQDIYIKVLNSASDVSKYTKESDINGFECYTFSGEWASVLLVKKVQNKYITLSFNDWTGADNVPHLLSVAKELASTFKIK